LAGSGGEERKGKWRDAAGSWRRRRRAGEVEEKKKKEGGRGEADRQDRRVSGRKKNRKRTAGLGPLLGKGWRLLGR
jgi:hypothetical protein